MILAEARTLARKLMAEHGLIEQGWGFDFDRGIVRFGCCRYSLKQITLSRRLVELNNEHEVRQTLLHEIAHALVGPEVASHGRAWKQKCIEIGGIGESVYNVASRNVVMVDPKERRQLKWTGTCPNCKRVVYRKNRGVISCGVCSRRFNPDYLFTWKPIK